MTRRPPWERFVQAAQRGQEHAGGAGPGRGPLGRLDGGEATRPVTTLSARARTLFGQLRAAIGSWLRAEASLPQRTNRRPDLRLLPAAAAAWAGSLGASRVGVAACLAGSLAVAGTALVLLTGSWLRRRRRPAADCSHAVGPGTAALALALLCTAAVGLSSSVQAPDRGDSRLLAALQHSGSFKATADITDDARPQTGPGPAGKGPATVGMVPGGAARQYLVGAQIRSAAPAIGAVRIPVLLSGPGLGAVHSGDRLEVTGKLVVLPPGGTAVAIFRLSSPPIPRNDPHGSPTVLRGLRNGLRTGSSWLPEDAAGLLPGMVVGDRSAVPIGLTAAMKTAGLTHLTAVSGANCTLIIAGLVLLARTLRWSRLAAAAAAMAGLALFVAVVGPDPSVLRAACMGLVGALGSAGGRPGRAGALLCATVVLLLLSDPLLGGSYAFILSVLATAGLVVLGTPLRRRLAHWVPDPVAALVSIPLAAQLACAPVLVLLAPQLTPYSLPANVAAAPVVGLVTIAGTLVLPALLLAPWLVPVLVALAGLGALWVAGMARFFAGLPAAALPWPAGAPGAALMAMLCLLVASPFWWAASAPRLLPGLGILDSAAPGKRPGPLRRLLGFPGVLTGAGIAAGCAAWCLRLAGML